MDLIKQYNEIGQDYIDGQNSFFSRRADWGKKTLYELLGDVKDKIVLDMGCGEGIDSLVYLSRNPQTLISLDSSFFMLEKAKEKIGNKNIFLNGTWKDIPLTENSVDIIIGRYSLHYEDSIDLAYDEVFRVLKPKGSLIFMVPHAQGDFYLKKEIIDDKEIVCAPLYDDKVIVRYPVHQLNEYFSDNFFQKFNLIKFREFIQEEMKIKEKVSTAIIIKAIKK